MWKRPRSGGLTRNYNRLSTLTRRRNGKRSRISPRNRLVVCAISTRFAQHLRSDRYLAMLADLIAASVTVNAIFFRNGRDWRHKFDWLPLKQLMVWHRLVRIALRFPRGVMWQHFCRILSTLGIFADA